MRRQDWLDAGFCLSLCALYLGIGSSFIMWNGWPALVGTLPAWVLLIATHFERKGPQA